MEVVFVVIGCILACLLGMHSALQLRSHHRSRIAKEMLQWERRALRASRRRDRLLDKMKAEIDEQLLGGVVEEKYEKAIEALRKIAKFGHAEGCNGGAPVHECCCYEKDEQEIAREVLAEIAETED